MSYSRAQREVQRLKIMARHGYIRCQRCKELKNPVGGKRVGPGGWRAKFVCAGCIK